MPSLRVAFLTLAWLGAALSAHAMSVVPPSFDELVAVADNVVRGEVTSVRSAYVDRPSGRVIRTFVTIHVERTLKGPAAPTDTLVLSFLGGTVGSDSLGVSGMPAFHAGDREIVFVGANGRTFCPLVAAGHGRYHLLHDAATDRDFVARDNLTPLESTADIVLPLETAAPGNRLKSAARALSPGDFETRIVEAVARLSPPAVKTQN